MTIVINNNFAHRLLGNGLIESVPVAKMPEGAIVCGTQWEQRDPAEMSLTWGEVSIIRDNLMYLAGQLPLKETPVPIQSPLATAPVFEPNAPVA